MTDPRPDIISQAVITDPMGRSAGGYRLVASSPSMLDEEGRLLEESPGLTDFMQDERSAGPYLSFFPLPTNRYFLVRRFISGSRRGGNRIVVHCLGFSEPLLELFAWDLDALRTLCGFLPTNAEDEQVVSLADLGKQVGALGLPDLSDLRCACGEDFHAEAPKVFFNKRQFLLDTRSWPPEQLSTQLCGIFQALRTGKAVLLPQGIEYEQLLILAWSALPPLDRSRIPWTSHFAPGYIPFRLANTPDPERTGALIRRRTESVFLEELSGLADQAPDTVRALAGVSVNADLEGLSKLRAGLWRYRDQFSLLHEDLRPLGRWLSYLSHGSDGLDLFFQRGSSGLDELKGFLSQLMKFGLGLKEQAPWVDPAAALAGVCHTGLRLFEQRGSTDIEGLLTELHNALVETDTAEPLLGSALALRRQAAEGPSDLAVDLMAIALQWRQHPQLSLRDVVALRRAMFAEDTSTARRELSQAQWAPLLALVQSGVGFVGLALGDEHSEGLLWEAVRQSPRLLQRLIKELIALEAPEVPLTRVLWGLAVDLGDDECATSILEKCLIPLLTDDPTQLPVFQGLTGFLQRCLPKHLVRCLRKWRDAAFDQALAAFKKRLEQAPDDGAAIALELTRAPLPEPFANNPFVCGLARDLAKTSVEQRDWLPFILAEARVLVGKGTKAISERVAFLHATEAETASVEPVADAILVAKRPNGTLPAPYRKLLAWILPAAADRLEDLSRLTRLLPGVWKQDKAVSYWAGPVEGLFARLIERGCCWEAGPAHSAQGSYLSSYCMHADALRRDWWHYLAGAEWERFPVDSIAMLWGLAQDKQERLMREGWLERVPELGSRPGEDRLLNALFELTEDSPDLQHQLRRYYFAGRLERGEVSLPDAVRDLEYQTRQCHRDLTLEDIDILLKAGGADAQSVLELLSSLPPSLDSLLVSQPFIKSQGKEFFTLFQKCFSGENATSISPRLQLEVARYVGSQQGELDDGMVKGFKSRLQETGGLWMLDDTKPGHPSGLPQSS